MYLDFLWVGRTKNAHLAALEQEYLRRIRHFAPSEIRALRAIPERDAQRARERESAALLEALRPGFCIVLWDERGAMLSSEELANWLRARQQDGTPGVSFLVGGPCGVSESVRQKADYCFSLSRLTLPHELVRVILLEQIYRSFAIIYGLPYAK